MQVFPYIVIVQFSQVFHLGTLRICSEHHSSRFFCGLSGKFRIFASHKYNAILNIKQKHILSAVLAAALAAGGFHSAAKSPDGRQMGLRTVCIDAGHGGKDVGCVSRDKKTHESDITLDIALKFSSLIRKAHPDVKVILTRSRDVFVTLGGRADIANKGGADLFISIHVDSAPSSTSARGYSIHVLGQSSHKDRDLFAYNMEICRRENSVMLMEDDYSTTYQGFDPSDPESFIFFNLMQNSHLEQSLMFAQDVADAFARGPIRNSRGIWQNPFYVLWKTSMPAALIELGFMSNASDLATLRSESGREKISEKLLEAFTVFKRRYDSSVSADGALQTSASSAQAPAEEGRSRNAPEKASSSVATDTSAAVRSAVSAGPSYGIQIMASAKKLKPSSPEFKGYEPAVIRSGDLYKYIVSVSSDMGRVKKNLPEVRKSFPGAFVVKVSE